MFGDLFLGDMTGTGAGGVKKGSPRSPDLIHDFFGEDLVATIGRRLFIANHGYQAFPAIANPDDIKPFTEGPDGYGPDGRIKPGNISAPGQNRDDPFFPFNVGHNLAPPY